MKRVNDILKRFLEDIGRLKERPLGDKEKELPSLTDEYIQFLLKQLRHRSRVSNKIIYSVITMYFVLFGLGLFIILYFLTSPTTIPLIFGGSSFVCMIAVVRGLAALIKENSRAKDLMTLIPELPQKETVKIIESLYYSELSK